jgi:hypothetical protein
MPNISIKNYNDIIQFYLCKSTLSVITLSLYLQISLFETEHQRKNATDKCTSLEQQLTVLNSECAAFAVELSALSVSNTELRLKQETAAIAEAEFRKNILELEQRLHQSEKKFVNSQSKSTCDEEQVVAALRVFRIIRVTRIIRVIRIIRIVRVE